ncbi:hypothetical protein DFH09DRAFT_1100622 [Mycena vulgaris]|nr:hypothetical protein DFH09DRAFT_1100622 [Mycena vulgaris]
MSATSDTSLLMFIKAKGGSAHPFKRVEVGFSWSVEHDIIPSLQRYISAGITVSVRYFIPKYEGARYSPRRLNRFRILARRIKMVERYLWFHVMFREIILNSVEFNVCVLA